MRQQAGWGEPGGLTSSRVRLGGLAQPQCPCATALGVLGLALMAPGPDRLNPALLSGAAPSRTFPILGLLSPGVVFFL